MYNNLLNLTPGRIQVGGEDEAYLYWREQGNLWQTTKGAMDLLRKVYFRE